MQRRNEITVILGKKGFGKTSYVVSVTNDLNRLIIFDYNREYQKGRIVTDPKQLLDQVRLNRDGVFRLIYRPCPEMDIEDHFNFFSEICFLVQNQTTVFEEVDLVSSAGVMPKGLKKIINYGRHNAINVLALSRRAHMVPRDLTANADAIISFNQQEPRDIKYLSDYFGGSVNLDGAEMSVETAIKGLRKTETDSEFLEWQNGNFRIGKMNFLDKSIFYK